MANNSIKMGNVRNNKLESIADIEVKIDFYNGFYYVPLDLISIGEGEFAVPDYSKIIKIDGDLPDGVWYYSTGHLDETHRNYVLEKLPDDLAVGSVYVFDLKYYKNSVYAYIESLDSIIIYANDGGDSYDTYIMLGYEEKVPLWAVNNNINTKAVFNVPTEKLFDLSNEFSIITVSGIARAKDGFVNLPQYGWGFEQMDETTLLLYIVWQNEYMEINGETVNMFVLSDGQYFIGCKLYDEH